METVAMMPRRNIIVSTSLVVTVRFGEREQRKTG